ncbi:MAG: biotin--[acetyl-CoA-carboxylase] ligase [Ignavibacteria bacterium]
MNFNLKTFELYLTRKDFLQKIEYFEEIDSTNNYLKNLISKDRTLVIADYQSAGRGRFNRKWISKKGENLMFSLGFENFQLTLVNKLNFLCSVTIAKAIEKLFDVSVEIKWPNDLLLDTKKFCGVLIENTIESSGMVNVIIGIGINCNQTEFPEEISNRATSLKLIIGNEINREKLLARITDDFANNWNKFINQPDYFYNEYKSKCFSIGKRISILFDNKVFTGNFSDITENGELILKTETQTLIFNSGEITTIKE